MTYRFGDFSLDVRTRQLLRGGEEAHVSPKAFDLLTILIENRAQAMSKNDLHQKLWPSTYVLETNLAGLVAEIRRALADPAESPLFVRTVHRFRYWFIAPVSQHAVENGSAMKPIKYWLLWDTRQIPLSPGKTCSDGRRMPGCGLTHRACHGITRAFISKASTRRWKTLEARTGRILAGTA